MNKSFLNFNDRIVSSGQLVAAPDLARELKSTTEQFIALARAANSAEDDDVDDISMQDVPPRRSAQSSISSRTKSVPSVDVIPTIEDNTEYTAWGYSQTFQPESSPEQERYIQTDPVSAIAHATSLVHHSRPQAVPWGEPESLVSHIDGDPIAIDYFSQGAGSLASLDTGKTTKPAFSLEIPEPALEPTPLTEEALALLTPLRNGTLRAPYTYSFQEKTFARRLHRAAVERCFHVLSEQPNHPVLRNRVLRLSLQFKTIDQLRDRFLYVLQRGVGESLENWHAPFIHLGGAGTHYPLKDANGNIIQRPNSYTVRRIGPTTQLENTQNPDMTIDLNCDLSDFAGEWFDSSDVEGYLQEKGVRIDPQASFAEAEIISSPVQLDMTMGPNMAGAGTGSSRSSGSDMTESTTASSHTRLETPNIFESLADSTDYSEIDNYLFGGLESVAMPMMQPSQDYFSHIGFDPNFDYFNNALSPKSEPAPPPVVEKRTVTLDVTKFITGKQLEEPPSQFKPLSSRYFTPTHDLLTICLHRIDQTRCLSWPRPRLSKKGCRHRIQPRRDPRLLNE